MEALVKFKLPLAGFCDCTDGSQVYKNKIYSLIFKNTLKMSKENVKLPLVKSFGKNFWQWSL